MGHVIAGGAFGGGEVVGCGRGLGAAGLREDEGAEQKGEENFRERVHPGIKRKDGAGDKTTLVRAAAGKGVRGPASCGYRADINLSLSSLIGKFRRLAANRGWPGAVAYCARRVVLGRRTVALDAVHPFDAEFGTETGGLIGGDVLGAGHAHDVYNTAYYGIAPSLFRELCRRWAASLASADEVKRYTFVDVGSGKGRALLLAAEMPFREVIGMELNAGLVGIAEKNIRRWNESDRAQVPIRVMAQDATEFEWPRTPLVIYLFNPFGRIVLERLIARVMASFRADPRPIDFLYVTPDHRAVFDQHEAFERVWSKRLGMNKADRAADLVSSVSELCNVYRVKAR